MNHLESNPRIDTHGLHQREDHAPGDESDEESGHWVRNANIGLGFSIVLTGAAFLLAGTDLIYTPAIPIALIVLAIAQMGVHLVFFLHITTGPGQHQQRSGARLRHTGCVSDRYRVNLDNGSLEPQYDAHAPDDADRALSKKGCASNRFANHGTPPAR